MIIIESLYGAYLGFALSAFAGITCTQWEYYAIGIPVIFLVEIRRLFIKEK